MESVRRRMVGVRARVEFWFGVALIVVLGGQFATIGKEPSHAALSVAFAFLAVILTIFAAIVRHSPLLGAAGVVIVVVVSWPRLGGGYVGVVGWLAVGLLFYILMRKPVKDVRPARGEPPAGQPATAEQEAAGPTPPNRAEPTNRPRLGDPDFHYLSPPPAQGPTRSDRP